jgi:hypothetical protein
MTRRWLLTLIALCSLSLFAIGQQTPRPDDATCRQYTKPAIRMNAGETGQTVKLDDLIDKKEQYIGKIVTVDGEMHRIFTDRVFTIEDDDLLRDDDVLVISDVPRAQAVVALEQSIDPGKNVRVTGFVHEYNPEKLECLYGPLQTESREGHSFTKSPVLIVQRVQVAEAEAPSETAPEQLALAAEPETPAPATEGALAQEERALPQTAGGTALLGILGLFAVLTACAIRAFYV